jgi:hypothetical protein
MFLFGFRAFGYFNGFHSRSLFCKITAQKPFRIFILIKTVFYTLKNELAPQSFFNVPTL